MEWPRFATTISVKVGKESTVLVRGRNQEDTRRVHTAGRSLGECGRDSDCVTNKGEEKRRRCDTTPLIPDLVWSGKKQEEEWKRYNLHSEKKQEEEEEWK